MNTEEFTATSILSRLLSRVSDDLDKREGSIIYDALAPAAWEMASIYRLLFSAYDEAFISTATGVSLDRRVEEMGITRRDATKAVCKGEFKNSAGSYFDITVGDRFSSLDPYMAITYVAIEQISTGIYRLEAVDAGSEANHYLGAISPITHISGLGSAVITEILIPGEDTESDEDLRARYLSFIQNEMQDGNVAQYQYWADNYDGLGRVKIFPLWNGANTVKVSILDADNSSASSELISSFQNYLDPDSEGLGNGVAPIGAKVTVTTATDKIINIAGKIKVSEGYLFSDVNTTVEGLLTSYFGGNAYDKSKVYYMEVGAVILSAEGVSSLSELTLNEGTSDITLEDEEIGALGTLALTEVTT